MIPSSQTGLSYKDRRSHQKRRFRFVGVVLLAIVVFLLFSSIVLQPWIFQTSSMEPTLAPGYRVLVSPYLFLSPENRLRRAPDRGDVVVILPPYIEESHWRFRIFDPMLRMVTFQKVQARPAGRMKWEEERVFKRVIAVPGDTVMMDESVAHVRSADGEYFISEFEMSGLGYDIRVEDLPEGWIDDLPLSGFMDEITLGDGEYFVLGDNRTGSNDSRYWGPIQASAIRGQALLIYWPLKNVGRAR